MLILLLLAQITLHTTRPLYRTGSVVVQPCIQPRQILDKQVCTTFVELDYIRTPQTQFFIWDETVRSDYIYTVIELVEQHETVRKPWWGLGFVRRKITSPGGLNISGLLGHTIHWEVH